MESIEKNVVDLADALYDSAMEIKDLKKISNTEALRMVFDSMGQSVDTPLWNQTLDRMVMGKEKADRVHGEMGGKFEKENPTLPGL